MDTAAGPGIAYARLFCLYFDEQIGVNIMKRSLEEPLRMISSNAGHEGAAVLGKMKEAKDAN